MNKMTDDCCVFTFSHSSGAVIAELHMIKKIVVYTTGLRHVQNLATIIFKTDELGRSKT